MKYILTESKLKKVFFDYFNSEYKPHTLKMNEESIFDWGEGVSVDAISFESGDGFEGTLLTGKDHNDEFYIDPVTGATRTKTNRSGGIQGGISNGENIVIKVAFKPTSTIGQAQVCCPVYFSVSSW